MRTAARQRNGLVNHATVHETYRLPVSGSDTCSFTWIDRLRFPNIGIYSMLESVQDFFRNNS